MARRGNPNFKAGPGRPKGSIDKKNRDIWIALDKLGCDPALGMAEIAMDPKVRPDIRQKAYDSLLRYCYATKREVELGNIGDKAFSVSWDDDAKLLNKDSNVIDAVVDFDE